MRFRKPSILGTWNSWWFKGDVCHQHHGLLVTFTLRLAWTFKLRQVGVPGGTQTRGPGFTPGILHSGNCWQTPFTTKKIAQFPGNLVTFLGGVLKCDPYQKGSTKGSKGRELNRFRIFSEEMCEDFKLCWSIRRHQLWVGWILGEKKLMSWRWDPPRPDSFPSSYLFSLKWPYKWVPDPVYKCSRSYNGYNSIGFEVSYNPRLPIYKGPMSLHS